MCTIKIKELISDKSYPEAGNALFAIIDDYIAKDNKVTLDLDGVEALPSMFLNVSLGAIIEKYGVAKMKHNTAFANITHSQIERLKVYIAHYQN